MISVLSRRKKFILLFLILVCLFSSYLQLFAVKASANSVEGYSAQIYVVGVPIDMFFNSSVTTNDVRFVSVLPDVNVYAYDLIANNTPAWVHTISGSGVSESMFSISYGSQLNSSADVFVTCRQDSSLDYVESNTPFVASSFSDLNLKYGATLGLNAFGFTCRYEYRYLRMVYSNGEYSFVPGSVAGSVTDFAASDLYSYVPLFNSDILDSQFFSLNDHFRDSEGNSFVCFTGFSLYFVGLPISSGFVCYVNDVDRYPTDYYDFYSDYATAMSLVSSSEGASLDVSFDDISWTDWLVNAVGGFMNFEIVPNLSFAGILALLVGMSLFMIFLKIFAGG